MKKLVLLSVVAVFIIALATSCKSTDCPAYAEVEVVEELAEA